MNGCIYMLCRHHRHAHTYTHTSMLCTMYNLIVYNNCIPGGQYIYGLGDFQNLRTSCFISEQHNCSKRKMFLLVELTKLLNLHVREIFRIEDNSVWRFFSRRLLSVSSILSVMHKT